MQTRIAEQYSGRPRIGEAEAILRSCVHCGFCNATCPTYLELGDERDGPRGRIYLIKQLLEGDEVGARTQAHLDRCLTCRSCETTCPSGVQYGRLVDIGRELIEQQVRRPFRQRLLRWLLKRIVPHRRRFVLLLSIGRLFRPLAPAGLRVKIPPRRPRPRAASRAVAPARTMLTLDGCVQAAATPNTNAAAARVLGRLGIELVSAARAGCCGALPYHLGDHREALDFARRNIDAWWPEIERGAEAVAISASGCGTMVKEYGHLLAADSAYAEKAAKVSELCKDICEILGNEDPARLELAPGKAKVAFHCPCTLQHGLKLTGVVEDLLTRYGFALTATSDAHLCCGSAGTYSILEPALSRQLLGNKLAALTRAQPDLIATANVGCQLHLESAATVPVRHWIELIDEALE